MRLILKLALAISIAIPSLPSAVNAQYLSQTERDLIWERERGRSYDRQRQDAYRLERERARNYYDGGNAFFNPPRYRYKTYRHRRNDDGAVAGAIIGLAGIAILGAIANQERQQQRPKKRQYVCGGNVTTNCLEGPVR